MTITPDEKDWRWVLERACGECGFDAKAFGVATAGERMRADALRWHQVLGRPQAQTRPNPATWSASEYACHVRDVADLFTDRLHSMLTEDEPQFTRWDQNEAALDADYAAQSALSVASQTAAALNRLAELVDAVPDDAWERRGRRSDGMVFTARTLTQYFLHDEIHHLYDVDG